MPSPIPPHEVQRALAALGVTSQDLDAIRQAPLQAAQKLLQELKANARRAYKRRALELHPDHTQGDAGKTAFFMLLGQVLADLDQLELRVRPVAPLPSIHCTIAGPSWQQARHVRRDMRTPIRTTFTDDQVLRLVRMRPR